MAKYKWFRSCSRDGYSGSFSIFIQVLEVGNVSVDTLAHWMVKGWIPPVPFHRVTGCEKRKHSSHSYTRSPTPSLLITSLRSYFSPAGTAAHTLVHEICIESAWSATWDGWLYLYVWPLLYMKGVLRYLGVSVCVCGCVLFCGGGEGDHSPFYLVWLSVLLSILQMWVVVWLTLHCSKTAKRNTRWSIHELK